jgi:predicted enzyme related to lactoylglutathione lyase
VPLLSNVAGMSKGNGHSTHPAIAWAEVTIDYRDTDRAAEFWSTLLGVPASKQRIEGWYQLAPTPRGPVLNLQPVQEVKSGKSRAHLDFWVDDLAASIEFVERLGGTVLNQHSFEEWTIAVMADLEGIEFCLVART